jgi:hypothetical protein
MKKQALKKMVNIADKEKNMREQISNSRNEKSGKKLLDSDKKNIF